MTNKITNGIIILITVILLGGMVIAIEPLNDKRPVDVPEDAEVELVEEIEEYSPTPTKETHLKIERLHKNEVHADSIAEIVLRITNEDDETIEVVVTEAHKPGLSYPDSKEIKKMQYEGLSIPYYDWTLKIPAKNSSVLMYRVKSTGVGMVMFSPAIVNDYFGNVFESAPTNIKFVCKPNGVCDSGENFIYCPGDCDTGSSDDICDGASDEKCDPDCEKEADPDCESQKTVEEESPGEVEKTGEEIKWDVKRTDEDSYRTGFDKNLLLVVAGTIILILIIIMIFLLMRRKESGLD